MKVSILKKKHVICYLVLIIVFPTIKAQNPIDGFLPSANDWVRVMIQQQNGDVLIGGRFTALTHGTPRSYVARLSADGSIDTAFQPDVNNEVVAMAKQDDLKIIIAGGFTEVEGVSRNRIARLLHNGTLDLTFEVNANGGIWAVALQEDGKIVIGGGFSMINNTPRNRIARLHSNGQLDLSFDPGTGAADGAIYAIAVQANQRIVIGGSFSSFDGEAFSNMVRLNNNGQIDSTLQANPNHVVLSLSLQLDGQLLVGGSFTETSGVAQPYLARYRQNGTLDTEFVPALNNHVHALAVDFNNAIYVGGLFTENDGDSSHRLARLYSVNGSSDGFENGSNHFANDLVSTILLTKDNKVLIGGKFTESLGKQRIRMAKFYRNGKLDQSVNQWVLGKNQTVHSLLSHNYDNYIAGSFSSVNLETFNNMAKMALDGSTSPVFNPIINGPVFAMSHVANTSIHQTEKILIGGSFSQINGLSANNIAKVEAYDGTLDAGFNTFTNGAVNALSPYITPFGSGHILVGSFTQVNGSNRNRIAFVNQNGALDPNFVIDVNNKIDSVVVMDDNKIVIGGTFTAVNGFERQKIARLTLIGGIPFLDAFNPAPNGNITAMTKEHSGNLLIGGTFNIVNGQSRRGIARLFDDGSVDPLLNLPLNTNGFINSFAVQADEGIVIGGQFSSVGGQTRLNTAKLLKSHAGDGSYFVANWIADSNATVNALMLQNDGKVWVGGQFTEINGQTRFSLARLNQKTAAQVKIKVTDQNISVLPSGTARIFQSTPFAQAVEPVNGFVISSHMTKNRNPDGWIWNHHLPDSFMYQPNLEVKFNISGLSSSGEGNGSLSQLNYQHKYFYNDLIFKSTFE